MEAAVLALVAFCTLGGAVTPFRALLRNAPIRWVFAYLFFAGISLSWSLTTSLVSSFAYWCGLVGDVLIVCLVLHADVSHEVPTSIMRGFVSAACVIAAVAWLMPAQADLRLGNEEFLNTNQIGNLCALAILLAQYLRRTRAQGYGLVLLLLSFTLLRSLSKSTLIAFFASQVWLLARDRSLSRSKKIKLACGMGVLLLMFSGLFAAYYDVYTRAGNQAQTLTGRTGIWSYVIAEIPAHPWFGHGFDSMWKIVPPFGPDRFEARHAENEVLQQLYSYGVCGLVLLLGVYTSLWRAARKCLNSNTRLMLSGLLVFAVVRGLVVAEPFDLLLPLWMCLLLSWLAVESGSVQAPAGVPALPTPTAQR